jgi:hypothetical protein
VSDVHFQLLTLFQLIASRNIKQGEEILVAYGGQCARWLRRQLPLQVAAAQEDQAKLEEFFYVAQGAVPRLHCYNCSKVIARNKAKNHALLCFKSKMN